MKKHNQTLRGKAGAVRSSPFSDVDGVTVVNGIALEEVIALGERYSQEIDKRGMPRAAQVFEALVMIAQHQARALAQQDVLVAGDDEWVQVPREPTEAMETAHAMYGDTSDWWQAVVEAAQQVKS